MMSQDPLLIEQYTQGDCHLFAIASHFQHGGSFLVAFDESEVHWHDEDGEPEIYSVLHIFARLNGPDGIVIRDICGDRPEDYSAIRRELSQFFKVWEEDIVLEEMTAEELHRLISDEGGEVARDLQIIDPLPGLEHDDRPLQGYTPDMLVEACGLAETQAAPGSRPLPPQAAEAESEPVPPECLGRPAC